MTATISPAYCKDCGSCNSWQRQPDQDIKSESCTVLWKRWRCKTCGATTIKPVPDESKKVDFMTAGLPPDNVNGQGGHFVRLQDNAKSAIGRKEVT